MKGHRAGSRVEGALQASWGTNTLSEGIATLSSAERCPAEKSVPELPAFLFLTRSQNYGLLS